MPWKTAWDRKGGIMKREITGISLQRPYTDQILTPKDMFDCYSEKISGIVYLYVSKEDIEENCR